MRKIYKIAFLSFFIGTVLFLISMILMASDSEFHVYCEWNKLTAVTTLYGLAYGAIMFSLGMVLADQLNKH